MAKGKSLLEEAIAEAKRVREAAIADATKRLEENLTPSIKEMLANKLEEELDLDSSDEEDLNENSNSGFKEVKAKSTVKEAEEDDDPSDDNNDDEEADASMDADSDAAPEESDEAPTGDDAPADADATDDPAAEEENDDDTPLKDITLGDLRTLIQDIVAAGQAPAEGGDLGADMDAGGVEGAGDEMPAGDLAADAEPEGEIPAAGAATADDEIPTDDAEDDDEEIDISEILRELEEEEKCPKCGHEKGSAACKEVCKENKANDIMPEDQTGKEHCKPANADSGKDQDQELNELKDELKRKDQEIKDLKENLMKVTKTLKDVNLLNGKLLYTTRILNKEGLSESQKVKAMKSLDEAKTPKEVKIIYNAIVENFKKSGGLVKESRQASRASRAAGRSTASNTIVESNDMVRRFQQLAGIIKD